MLNQIEKQELVELVALPDAIRMRLEAAERENGQLREALATRIVIEQAKGVLAERFGLDVSEAFELLRRSARCERRRIHDLAAEVVGNGRTTARIQALAAEVGALDDRTWLSGG